MRTSAGATAHPELVCERGVVAAGHRREAEAGAAMLEAGGNAVDAAVAAAFVGFVVEQCDCGVGGFAHVSVWSGARGRSTSFDGYVCAPHGARADLFVPETSADRTYYGHPATAGDLARHGALAVAVPGAVAALLAAHERMGRLPRAQVLEPAIAVADAGVPFGWRDALIIGRLREQIAENPAAAAVLLPGGRIPRTPVQLPDGDRLDTAALADTLRRIARDGARGFYTGATAAAIAAAVRRGGGILSAPDLEGYSAVVRDEPPARYRGHAFTTCFDSVACEALGILDGFDLGAAGAESFAARHLMAEALAVAFTDTIAYGGDPHAGDLRRQRLSTAAFAAARRNDLRRDRALPRPVAPRDPLGETADGAADTSAAWEGTSQIVAADADGNMVSIITAVGWDFGSLVYVPEAGLFLNNGMSYFDPRPGRPNSIAPGRRPTFGAPALVMGRDRRARLAAAGSGGYRIATAVLHAATGVIDYRLAVDAAIERPRVHCQGGETFACARIPTEIADALRAAGHQLVVVDSDASTWHFGRVCAAVFDPESRTVRASAGPHWLTGVAGT